MPIRAIPVSLERDISPADKAFLDYFHRIYPEASGGGPLMVSERPYPFPAGSVLLDSVVREYCNKVSC
jgi:hypothetical protein